MTAQTYTGRDASFVFKPSAGALTSLSHSAVGLSSFSLSISRDTVTQNLLGQSGNYEAVGAKAVEGSFKSGIITKDALLLLLDAMINGNYIYISGMVGDNSIHFELNEVIIKGFNVSMGDANTFTAADIDYTVRYPYKMTTVHFMSGNQGTFITDGDVS